MLHHSNKHTDTWIDKGVTHALQERRRKRPGYCFPQASIHQRRKQ